MTLLSLSAVSGGAAVYPLAVSLRAQKAVATLFGVVAVAVLIGIYVTFLTNGPTPYRVPSAAASGHATASLTLQTVAAIGPKLAPNETWVSYLVRENGTWHRSTVWTLPANALVHVTVYHSTARAACATRSSRRPAGSSAGTFTLNGKSMQTINPDDASHTFAIPALGVIVPLQGVDDNAKNQCDFAPCALSNAHDDDHLHLPDGEEGPLPLAVLRPVRGRLPLRLRRADADDRLHGRVRRMSSERHL